MKEFNFYSISPVIGFNRQKFEIGYESDDGRGHSPWFQIYFSLYIISMYLTISKVRMEE